MGYSRQPYSQDAIERVESIIRNNGKLRPVDYEIRVDGNIVVRRTNDLELFYTFEEQLSPATFYIDILVFYGESRNNNKFNFFFREGSPAENGLNIQKGQKALNGLENIDEKVNERVKTELERARKEWEFAKMQSDLVEAEETIDELEVEIEELEKQLNEVSSKQSPLNGLIGGVGSSLIESFIKNNPKILSAIPGGQALAGLMEGGPTPPSPQGPEPEVTFRRKESNEGEITQEQREAIAFVDSLRMGFSRENFDGIIEIINLFAQDESQVKICLELLKSNKL